MYKNIKNSRTKINLTNELIKKMFNTRKAIKIKYIY